jgi:hypothetical protein
MSFPPGTEMFQFPGFASTPYVFRCRYPFGWVSPFGNPRINDCSHLPAAYRSVPRPSSPLGAKASTERSYRAHQNHTCPHAGPSPTHISVQPKLKCPATTTSHSFTPHPSHPKPLTRPQRPRHVVTNHSDSPVKQHRHPAPTPSEDLRRTAKPVVQRHVRALQGTAIQVSTLAAQPSRHSQHPLTRMETVGIEPTAPCLQSRCSTTELRPRNLARNPARHPEALVGQGGLEPPTPRLSSVCSNQLSYWPKAPKLA